MWGVRVINAVKMDGTVKVIKVVKVVKVVRVVMGSVDSGYFQNKFCYMGLG